MQASFCLARDCPLTALVVCAKNHIFALDAFKEKDLLKAHGVMMLNEIYKTLKEHQGDPLPDKVHDKLPNKLPNKIPNKVPNKLRTQYPDLSDASVLRDAGIIERIGGNKTGYWE